MSETPAHQNLFPSQFEGAATSFGGLSLPKPKLSYVPEHYPDDGRLSNSVHVFLSFSVQAGRPASV